MTKLLYENDIKFKEIDDKAVVISKQDFNHLIRCREIVRDLRKHQRGYMQKIRREPQTEKQMELRLKKQIAREARNAKNNI